MLNDAIACINSAFAECVQGKWVLTKCPNGLQCFALPLVNDPGTTLVCDSNNDAASRFEIGGVQNGIPGNGAETGNTTTTAPTSSSDDGCEDQHTTTTPTSSPDDDCEDNDTNAKDQGDDCEDEDAATKTSGQDDCEDEDATTQTSGQDEDCDEMENTSASSTAVIPITPKGGEIDCTSSTVTTSTTQLPQL
ncbi:hypothetical protein C0992_008818 [Termitomyces sp. T32_za158]|nr:hypothetical protein C0992_008818 [Termitomyces sp. T32_za158]